MARPIDEQQTESVKRTQAERHAETRRKIIDATVACIDSFGFPKTTMQKVARKAGVTVGAVQHHFPSKSELLAGVLEDGFRKASFAPEYARFSGKRLQERVALFVDHCWLLYREPAFQANLHILLGMRDESPEALDDWLLGPLADMTALAKHLWLTVFDDVELTEDEHKELLYFVFSVLSGTATFARIIDAEHRAALIESNLGALKELLQSKFLRVQNLSTVGPESANV
jgi:AcrR family transcriptional regulator